MRDLLEMLLEALVIAFGAIFGMLLAISVFGLIYSIFV